MPTPTMRVKRVDDARLADFAVREVSDITLASLDVGVVSSDLLADARVINVSDPSDADEFIYVSEGVFTNPNDIPATAWWLDGDDPGGYTNGQLISLWEDKSPFARGPSASGTQRPTYRENVFHGRGAVEFNGTSNRLRYPSPFLQGQKGSILAVVKFASVAGFQDVVSSADEASSTRYWLVRQIADNFQIVQRNDDTETAVLINDMAAAGVWHVIEWYSTGTAYEIVVDGRRVAPPFTSGAGGGTVAGANGDWVGDTSARDNVCLGATIFSGGTVNFLNGQVAEVVVADNYVWSQDERDALRRWVLR